MQVMILLKGIGVASRSVSLAEQAVFFGFHTVGDIHTMISMFGQRWGICTILKKTTMFFFPIWHPRSEKIPQTDGVEYSRQFNWGFLGTFQWFYVLYKVVLRSSLSWLVTVNLGFIVAISSLESRVNGGYKSTVKWRVPPCAYLNLEVLCHILVGYIYIYIFCQVTPISVWDSFPHSGI